MSAFDPPDEGAREGDTFDPKAPYVRPKDAATLILVRRDGPAPRVLMGRRGAGHVFMPDKWVFPGGRLDRADFTAPAASELRPEVAARLEKTADPRRARALALCAVRETFEEAGLLLARPGAARRGGDLWRPFLERGVLPDLGALDFVARAVTPTYRARRFDARFFMADARALAGLDRAPDCGELDEIAWFELERARGLDLPMITRFVLGEIEARLNDPLRPAPSVRLVRGRRVVEAL